MTERGWLVVQAKEKILTDIEVRWGENIGIERMQMLKEDLTKLVNEDESPMKIRPVW